MGKRTPSVALGRELIPVYLGAYRYPAAEKLISAQQAAGNDSADLHYWQGRIFSGQGRLDEAVSAYSKAINRDEAYASAYRYRAGAFKIWVILKPLWRTIPPF